MRYFKLQNFNFQEITTKLQKKNLTIGIIIPTYNEEKTISNIVSVFSRSRNLINNVYVIDDGSNDNTVIEAERAGATVFNRKKIGDKKYYNYNGKGFAIFEALALVKEDILIVYDGDVKNPNLNHIISLSAPLINNPELILTKASFDRNLYLQDKRLKKQGGRMTELLIKPLIGFLFPDLVVFQQPTGGFYAVRKNKLKEVEILGEAGADVSVLINLYKKNGLNCLSEVYIGEIRHDNKSLSNLSKNSYKHIQSLFYLKKGIDNFTNYSHLSTKENILQKVKVESQLVVLKPKDNVLNSVAKVIIYNNDGEFLLQLRDNNPDIKYCLHWNLLGGVVDKGETPKETILRELNEEIGINTKDIDFYYIENDNGVDQYVYMLNMDVDVNNINLKEGLSLKWFKDFEIDGLKIGFNYQHILRRFKDDKRDNSCSGTK